MKKFKVYLDGNFIIIKEGESIEQIQKDMNKGIYDYRRKTIIDSEEITDTSDKMNILEEVLVNILWATAEHEDICMWNCAGLENVGPLMNKRIQMLLLNLDIDFETFKEFVSKMDMNKLQKKYKDKYERKSGGEVHVFLLDIFSTYRLPVYIEFYEENKYNRFIKCIDCDKIEEIEAKQVQWFINKGFQIPKRCNDCRQKRKKCTS